MESVRQRIDHELIAHVILPDHFHVIFDPHERDFTGIMQRVKMSFDMHYRRGAGLSSGRVWQHRYWDHVIRDQSDLNRHIDYIHYNPVKHGFARSPLDWEHSSIHEYAERGLYQRDWGQSEAFKFDGEFGE